MALFLTMEEQAEEKTEQKPLSIPAQYAENIDDLLAALTIEELLKKAAKKLPQVDKNKQSEGSSKSDRPARNTMFISPINSVVSWLLFVTVVFPL